MFENISKKLSETGKVIGDKTKQVSETTQLNYKMITAEKEKEALFTVLGKAVYENAKADSQSPFFEDCEKITAKQEEIDELKKKLDSIKGIIICQSCGAECDSKNDYCGKCGTKLNKPVCDPPAEYTGEAAEETAADEISEDKGE